MLYTIIAQAVGIMATAFNVGSYQCKSQKGIIALQLIGAVLFSAHYFMLGAYTGGLLNAIAIVRAFIYLYKDKMKADHILWLYGFFLIFLLCYAATFTLFDKPFTIGNAFLEILPVIGMTVVTISFQCKTAKGTRVWNLIKSPFWLTYNIVTFAMGGIICEVISIVSIIVALKVNKE